MTMRTNSMLPHVTVCNCMLLYMALHKYIAEKKQIIVIPSSNFMRCHINSTAWECALKVIIHEDNALSSTLSDFCSLIQVKQ